MALGAAYIKIGEPVEGFREYQRVLVPDHAGARQALDLQDGGLLRGAASGE